MKQITKSTNGKLALSTLLDHNLKQNSEGFAIWRAIRRSDESIYEFQLVYINDGIDPDHDSAGMLIGKFLSDLIPEHVRYQMHNILKKVLSNHHSKHDYLDIKGVFGWEGTYENIVIPLTHDEVLVKYRNSVKNDSGIDKLQWMLQHDALTGVINRISIEKLIDKALLDFKTTQRPFVFGIIDIDDFHSLNELHGNRMGDEILKSFAFQLESALPNGSQVIQMGGDEFALVLNDHFEIEKLKSLARQLATEISEFSPSKGTKVKLGFSAGYVLVRNNRFTAEEIYQLANSLMYKVKNQENHGFLISVCHK